MEFENIVGFFENKTILVTGVTGFLAKVFIEKILRVQPNVKKLYLLLRAADDIYANQRFRNELIEKELFTVAKEKFGNTFNSIVAKKIRVVPGDVGHEDLGIKDSILKEEMKNGLDFVVNFAACTNFDERYDVAFATNTMGAKNVLSFAKTCLELKLLVQISTAYVCGEKSGLILEEPCLLNETYDGVYGLDIDREKELIDQKLQQLEDEGLSQTTIKDTMKDLGIQRANNFGWPNTYVFTKAMGEMIIQHEKGDVNVVVIRPTIVSSTLKEPFPGWTEGIRTIDAFIAGIGRGKLKFLTVDLEAIVDVIPADMVINVIVVAMVGHANKPYGTGIYHVGSSARNALKYYNLRDYIYEYFTNKPYIDKDGKPTKLIKPTVLTSIAAFYTYLAIIYLPLLLGLKLANSIFFHWFEDLYNTLERRIKFAKRLVQLYRPYLFFPGIFDDSNIEMLLKATNENSEEMKTFFFDVKYIDWDAYFMNIHIPGILQYVLKNNSM